MLNITQIRKTETAINNEIIKQTNGKFDASQLDDYELNLLVNEILIHGETVEQVVTNLLQSE